MILIWVGTAGEVSLS